uniref:MFS transporter n=1 Tax=candidate division WOR-3 bacterium TaxID=2052148 RepID=A0A7V3V0Q1_UNCW3
MLNIIIAGITSLLTDMSTEMVYPLIPIYLASLGTPPAILGLIEGFAESSAALLKLFSGNISDRWRRRKPLAILGYAGSTIGKLFLYFSRTWSLVFIGRMIDRIGKGIRVAPRDALIADASTIGTRGRAFGLHRALDTVGAALGVIIAILIVARLGTGLTPNDYHRIFLISLIPAFFGVLFLFFIRETCHPIPTLTPKLSFKNLPPKLRRFLIIIGIFALGNSSNQFLLLRMNKLGWSTLNILLLYLLYNLTYAIFAYPAGKLADRFGTRKLLITGYTLYSAVYFGFALLNETGANSFLPYLLFLVYGLFSAITEGQEKALVAEIAQVNQRATLIGLHAAITGFGLLPASLLAGLLWNLFGPKAPFIFGGFLGLSATIGLATLI